jgi:hypothetical protein
LISRYCIPFPLSIYLVCIILSQSQYQGIDSLEGRYLPVGLTGLIGVASFDDTYQGMLSAMSLRDYISTELGAHLPLFVSTRLWR